MPTVTKTMTGYSIRLSLTDPLTGRRVQKRVSARTRRALDAEVAKIRTEWNSGSWIEPDKTTLAAWLATWLATYRESPASQHKRGGHIRNHIAGDPKRDVAADPIAAIPLVRLRYAHCQDWVDRLIVKGLAPNTIRSANATLSLALSQAVRRQLIASNPCSGVALPSAGTAAWCVLDDEQARRLVTATRDDPYHALWTLAVTLGIRRGELLVLTWATIDLTAGLLRIERTMSVDADGHRIIKDGAKSQTSRRSIRLPVVCIDALRRHRARQNARRLAAGDAWMDTGLVFDGGLGERLGETAFYTAFRTVKRELDLPDELRPHDLRHTAATLMLYAGVPIPTVASLLGHASPVTTMRVYAHVLRAMEDEAAGRIDTLFQAKRAGIVPAAQ